MSKLEDQLRRLIGLSFIFRSVINFELHFGDGESYKPMFLLLLFKQVYLATFAEKVILSQLICFCTFINNQVP